MMSSNHVSMHYKTLINSRVSIAQLSLHCSRSFVYHNEMTTKRDVSIDRLLVLDQLPIYASTKSKMHMD